MKQASSQERRLSFRLLGRKKYKEQVGVYYSKPKSTAADHLVAR